MPDKYYIVDGGSVRRVPEDKEQKFLKKYPDSREATNKELSYLESTNVQQDQQNSIDNNDLLNEIKQHKSEFFKPYEISGTTLNPFKKKTFSETAIDTKDKIPVNPQTMFDISADRYKQANEWIDNIQNDDSISHTAEKEILDHYNSNIRTGDDTLSTKDLPPAAMQWLEENKQPVKNRRWIPANKQLGESGHWQEYTEYINTPDQVDFIKDYIANSADGKRYMQAQKEWIDGLENEIEPLLKEANTLRNKAAKELNEFNSDHGTESTLGGLFADRDVSLTGKAINVLKDAKKLLDANRNGKGFWKGLHMSKEDLAQFATFSEFTNDANLNQVIDKYEKDPTSLSQEELLAIKAKYIADQITAGVDPGSWYNIGYTTKQSLPFMRDFIISAPAGAGASGVLKNAVTGGLKKGIRNEAFSAGIGKTFNTVGKGALDLSVRPAVQSMFSPSSYAMAFQEMQGFATDKDEKGNIKFDDRKSFGHGMTSAFIENQSEVMGEVVLDKLFQKLKIPVPAFLQTNAAKRLSQATGIQQPFTEYLEEKYSDLANIVRGEETIEGFFDPRQNIETFGAVAVMQVPFAAINSTGYGIGKVRDIQAKRAIKKAYDVTLKDFNKSFGKDAEESITLINEIIDSKDKDAIRDVLIQTYIDPDLNNEQKHTVSEYVIAYSAYSGVNLAKKEDIEKAKAEIISLVEENFNPDMDALVSANVAGYDSPVQIVGGDIKNNDDGSIDRVNSKDQVFYIDPEGKKKVTSIELVESLAETIPKEDAISQLSEVKTSEIITQQENEEVREYLPGETVTVDLNQNGILFTGEIASVIENGNYLVVDPTTGQREEVEPVQIINQDNIKGIETGSAVQYYRNGEIFQDTIANAHSLRHEGLIPMENGDVIPISDIIGPVKEEKTSPEDQTQSESSPVVENNVTFLDQIPKNSEGKILFEQVSTDVTLGAIKEVFNESQELINTVDANISSIQNQIEQAKISKPTGDITVDIANKQESKLLINNLSDSLSYWQKVRDSIKEPTKVNPTGKKDSKLTSFQKRLNTIEPNVHSIYDRILFGIASGSYKFRWKDNNISSGLASELGLSGSETERKARIGILSNSGYTPTSLAHHIWEETGMEQNDHDIRNEIIDVLNSITSRTQALEMLESKSGISEEEYNKQFVESSEYEKGLKEQEQLFISEIIEQLNIEDLLSLKENAVSLGATVEQIEETQTATDFIDLIEQLQYGQQEQTSDRSGNNGQIENDNSEGSSHRSTKSTTEHRDRSVETTGNSDKDTVSSGNGLEKSILNDISKAEAETNIKFTETQKNVVNSLYGNSNKIISSTKYDELKKQMRDKLNNLNSGFDPEIFTIGTQMAMYHMEAGARKFTDFASKMIEDLGDGIRPFLKSFYESARQAPGMENYRNELDKQDIINNFDINNFNPETYVHNLSGNSTTNSTESANDVSKDEGIIPGRRGNSGRNGNGTSSKNNKGSRQQRSQGGSGLFTPLFGEQSDQQLHPDDGPAIAPESITGITDGRGNSINGSEGLLSDGRTNSAGNRKDNANTTSFAQRLELKREEQRKAENTPVRIGDLTNIKQTLPYLLPEQQEDVLKAETRFFSAEHKSPELANGKGFLFTNGTGTGKTYTGLGIIKRFVKQGKKEILIVVPTQPKITDWVQDGTNLNLSITPLQDTSSSGSGIVITTYANFRTNNELLKREFDLVVYDESHRIMEDKDGSHSSTTYAHYYITNRDKDTALSRLKKLHPLWIEESNLCKAIDNLPKDINGDMPADVKAKRDQKEKSFIDKLKKIRDKQEKVLPKLEENAKIASDKTKVVFLSATPFKGHFNLRYANKYLFDWGNETTYEGRSRVNPESRFFLDNFGGAYTWKNHQLQSRPKSNPDAIAMQEVEFAEKLMTDGVMSGRTINSEMDYSREFPIVAGFNSELFNKAFADIFNYQADEFAGLRSAASDVFHNYQYTTRLFEALKTSMSISRIRKHLDLGRKIVVFHRRQQSGVTPPFRTILNHSYEKSKETLNRENISENEIARAKETLNQIKKFESKYKELLEYEQTLNYKPCIEQIKEAFPGRSVFVNGAVSTREKNESIKQFNTDDSGKDIIVLQEDSGKEGISLHDRSGKHQRVLMSISMPISSVTALQIEGRTYRIGQESDAIFEYPLLGLDLEIDHFGRNINRKLSTTENLAIGKQSRDLIRSFAEGVLFNSSKTDPHLEQGKGGKEYDQKSETSLSEFQKARLIYDTNHKKRERRDQREGVDYYATPEPIGQKMVEWLGLKNEESALEPSAGHGAISMWFPSFTKVTAIEPSFALSSKLSARTGGGERRIINNTFEEHNIVNKYDGIAMNPPFGKGGKTAVEHLEKAFRHLKDYGRVICILPNGNTCHKYFELFISRTGKDGKALYPDAHIRAIVEIPGIAFEQAGTNVNTRMVVIDKIPDTERLESGPADYSYKNIQDINELFDNLESLSLPPRITPSRKIDSNKTSETTVDSDNLFKPVTEYIHTKTNDKLGYIKLNKLVSEEDFNIIRRRVKDSGGAWSRFAKGFIFSNVKEAQNFIDGYDNRKQITTRSFSPLSRDKFEKLVETLKLTGLSTDVIITDNIQDHLPVEDKEGKIYGFVSSDGKVYLDARNMNANTPIHEFGHLWNSFIKSNNPLLYNIGIDLVKQSPYWDRVNNNPDYSLLTEEQKAEEALAMAIGDKGEAFLNRSLSERFMDWLKELLQNIKKTFGISEGKSIENMTLSDFTDKATKEILGGKDLTQKQNKIHSREDVRIQSVNDLAKETGSSMTEEVRNELDLKLKKFRFKLREAWEDRHLAVKEFLDVLRSKGIEIPYYNDFYLQATHINGKIDSQLEYYNEKFQKPLTSAIRELEKSGLSYRTIENYTILKHGLERNEWMRNEATKNFISDNPGISQEAIEGFTDSLPTDYSGITAVEKEVKKKAEEYITEIETKTDGKLINDFWQAIKNATSFSLGKQLEGGLINKATYEDIISRYNHYIPLRGHDKEVAEDRYDYTPDMGTFFVAPLIKAKGRKSRSESPFAFISSMAQSSINASNRNILNQSILRLAMKENAGLLSASLCWYVQDGLTEDGKPTYSVESPTYSDNPEQYRKNIEEFEERMQILAESGLAYQSGSKLNIGGLFIKRKQAEQHEVHVFQNGKEYTVYFNANPAVARAINDSNAKDLHKDLQFIAKVSRQMAANFTTRNPVFVATNFSRDYIYASTMLMVKENAKYALQFQRNIPQSAGALQRYICGKADLSNKHDQYAIEYIMNGGKTGFSHILELNKIQKKLKREIKNGHNKNPLRSLLDVLEGCNEFAENLSRLSVYITSRQQGRNITQSISDAKEVTVNFNRGGAGGYGASLFRSLYLFVNAGIQGISNFAKVAQKNPGKTTSLIASYTMTGVLMPLLTSLIGGDEGLEDYMKLSDWERQNNLCIYTGGGFIKIPLPHELRVFHAMGDNIYQASFGRKDITESLLDIMLSFSDLIPSEPIGAATATFNDFHKKDTKEASTTAFALISPDALKPFAQLIANRNFMGGYITNEWADPNKPGYLRIRTNKKGEPYAPAFLVKLAESLDTMTGGDGVETGFISFNPDIVNHVLRGYFGGLYTIGIQAITMADKTYELSKTGEFNLKVRETPLKTFYASSDDLMTTSSGLNAKYFSIADEMKEIKRKMKGYNDQVNAGDISVEAYGKKIGNMEKEINRYYEVFPNIKQIQKYEKELKEMNDVEQKEAEKIISDLKKEVIELNKINHGIKKSKSEVGR